MRTLLLAMLTTFYCSAEGVVSAQTTANTAAIHNKAIVEASLKAWANGTGSPYDLLADDARWTIVGRSAAAKSYQGREAFMREVIRPFNARMKAPLKPEIRHLYADGDTVIAFFDASGTAADGKPYTNTYAWILEMRNGQIITAHAFFDSLAFNELWTRVTPSGVR